jgi:hypothetical protein
LLLDNLLNAQLRETGLTAMNLQHVARYFKQQDFSDVDLELVAVDAPSNVEGSCQDSAGRHAAADHQLLAQFPAHRLVLAGTEYFKAQVRYA